ncbi:unnamed protein product [Arctia plantaginis]|uniref:PIN domain-containing protein n=1 Tax=Arctia plantaginis TaxID=874455 RepID=A0A8S1ATT2_ARCPL|nr:unnamed protein product [Arctia plantaginis]
MSGDKEKSARKKVTSVGNAWIVTQSKSHPGLVYYFNTVTREAVWNLSELEIEKARLATQMLESHSGSKPACPEPKDNPPTQEISNQFNNPVTNHHGQRFETTISKIPQQADNLYSEQNQPEVTIIQTQKQPGAIFSTMPMSNLSSIDFNALNNQINAFNLIGTQNAYNPTVWTLPHAQQFFVTPTIPLVNQSQATLNVGYNQLLQDHQAGAPRFTRLNNMQNGRHRFFQPRNTVGRGRYRNKSQPPLHATDLRERLSSRRKEKEVLPLQTHIEDTPVLKSAIKKTADVSSYIADIIETVSNNHDEEDENGTEIQKEEIKSNLDLTPLKSLAMNDNLENWYIVVDFNVLLEEFNFLSDLTNSDENCTLLVPNNVMSELKDYVACSNNIPARCIYYSLLERIESGRVTLGQEPSEEYENSITNPILKTCFRLLEDNIHVILLTNDKELLRYKKFIKVNMFTVDEIKTLLEYPIHQQRPNLNTPLSLKNLIKITIPSKNPPATGNVSRESTQRTSAIEDEPHAGTVIKEIAHVKNVSDSEFHRSIEENQSDFLSRRLKYAVDAAIQTDTVMVTKEGQSDTVIDEVIKTNVIECPNKTESKKASQLPVKRREIKLKRSIPNNTAQSSNTVQGNEKKTFRWRRRRRPSFQGSGTSNSNKFPCDLQTDQNVHLGDKNLTIKEADTGVDEHLSQVSNNNHETEYSSNLDEIVQSRDSSICLNKTRENITIEETSTSGVISNTESNVDSEYLKCKDSHRAESYHESKSSNSLMHIDSENMEESLRIKCEEWVSRFIQIMEEVLAVILHKEPAFANSALAPPWTLHEAAQCIGKYTTVAAVKHASDKLSRVLFDISDSMGKIPLDITPAQYMELYNNGVSLLKEIKAITTHHEDIKIAEEYLQKLLIDIKNPHYGLNDSDIDPQENTEMSDPLNNSIGSTDSQGNKKSRLDVLNQAEDNLTCPRKASAEEPLQQPKPVKIIRNLDIKTSFFSSLKLQKVTSVSPILTKRNKLCDKQGDSEQTHVTFSSGNPNDESEKSLIHFSSTLNTPNIIRNFTKCPEFEKKLRNEIDVNECEEYDQYNEEDYEYNSTECGSDEFDISDDDAVRSDPNVTQMSETPEIDMSQHLGASSPKSLDLSIVKNNNTFKVMMHIFLQEVRNAIREVKVLCDKCYAELKTPQLPTLQRNELKTQIENARSHIFGLCVSLESMLDRDPNAPTDNILTVCEKAGIDTSHIDDNLLSEYWNTIANCKKNADIFLFSIQEIIAAFKPLSD